MNGTVFHRLCLLVAATLHHVAESCKNNELRRYVCVQGTAHGPVEIVHWTNITVSFPEELWKISKKSRLNNGEWCFLDLDANGIRNRNDRVRFECHETLKTVLKTFRNSYTDTLLRMRAQYVLLVTRCFVAHAWFNSLMNYTRLKPLIVVGGLPEVMQFGIDQLNKI